MQTDFLQFDNQPQGVQRHKGVLPTVLATALAIAQRTIWLCALPAAIVLLLFTASPVSAAGVVGNGAPASCTGNALQTALEGGGLVTFNCGDAPHTIIANTYVIDEPTTIFGGGRIALDGEALRQIFLVGDGGMLTLQHITLQHGNFANGGCIYVENGGEATTRFAVLRNCMAETGDGGAVYNQGAFTAHFTELADNYAQDDGGAIFNAGTLNLFDAKLVGNDAGDSGGAINQINGSTHVQRTLFDLNQAANFGGGINLAIGALAVTNTTFYDNRANQGGGLYSDGGASATIHFSTFVANRAEIAGAVWRGLAADVSLGQSILAGSLNRAGAVSTLNCDGPSLDSEGDNIIDDNSCVTGAQSSDQRSTDPRLGPLQDNGGYAHTLLPNGDSPALEMAPEETCVPVDQRDMGRRGVCDIGAAERTPFVPMIYLPVTMQ